MHDHSKCKHLGQHQLNDYVDRKGCSQEDLGELIGVSQQTASKYLSGAVPSRYAIVRRCEVKCGVKPGAFNKPLRHKATDSAPSAKAA